MRLFLAVFLLLLAWVASPHAGSVQDGAEEGITTTHHRITVGGKTFSYTARAGRLPIRHNDTGETHGQMFFISYTLARTPNDSPRPLTFLWNGGPGANSTLVHLSGFGPKRIKTGPTPLGPPECECELEDNQETWLDQTDLVFVDPIGTGFSRPTRKEYAGEFYNTLGDIASVAEFVRVYRTRFDAWDAPLFIGGESYGVWRAGGVAEILAQRRQKVAGVILISGGIPLGPVLSDEMRVALFVPTRTATAFFHKKLASDLQSDQSNTLTKSEAWAKNEYATALTRRDGLNGTERQAILTQLSRFTGVDIGQIDQQSLILTRQKFAETLLGDRRQLARFDTRQIAGGGRNPLSQRNAVINKYLRTMLAYKTDLAYQGVEDGFWTNSNGVMNSVGARWNYNQGPPPPPGTPPSTDAPPGGSQPWLRRAMAVDPSIKAFVATGLYDSLNSCAAHNYVVNQLEPDLRKNFTAKCYIGGHMMYDDLSERQKMKQDITVFLQSSTTALKRP